MKFWSISKKGDKMKRHYKRKRKNYIKPLIITVAVMVMAAFLIRLEFSVRKSAEIQAENAARLAADRIIAESISDIIEKNEYTYSDFAAVLYDENGRASSVEALTVNINRVQAELSEEINRRFAENSNADAKIAMGSLSGSYILAGRGPKISIRVCPIGKASVSLKSTFDSAGINQTRHRIYAEVSMELISSIPIYSFETTENFELLIAETIIVGDVPDFSHL